MSDQKRENVQKLMKYQNERGGRIVMKDVKVSLVFGSMHSTSGGIKILGWGRGQDPPKVISFGHFV